MERRTQLAFLLVVIVQAAHSIEEYITKLYDVVAPARFLSSLVSNNLSIGFLVANAALVAFGLWCCAVPVRSGSRAGRGLAWLWALLELGNGTGHALLAASRGGYFPGLITAPFLVAGAAWLLVLLMRQPRPAPPAVA